VDEATHDALCIAKVVSCPAADVGCDHQCTRLLLSQHISTCSILPLRIILLKQQAMEQQIKDMAKELKESKARIHQLEATVLVLKQGHHQQTNKVNEEKLNRFQPGLGTALQSNTIGKLALKKTPNFQESVFEALAEALHSNSSLQHLELRECDFLSHKGNQLLLGEALRVNSGLTTLYITSCQLGDQGAQAIAEAFHTKSTLQQLGLNDNRLGDQGAQAIAEALHGNSSLISLNLRSNSIGDRGARAIATALHTNSTLQSLDLQDNEIGDQGAQVLAGALASNSSLQLFNIMDNKIDSFGIKALGRVQGQCAIRL